MTNQHQNRGRLLFPRQIASFVIPPDDRPNGVVRCSPPGSGYSPNEAFLCMVGYRREDMPMNWREWTPPEWRDVDEERIAELMATGIVQPYEKEFFHSNGGRVPVLIGAAMFEGAQDTGVAFILDLTERKKAEQAARDSERRYHEIEVALAHANRLVTMGQLTASIAYEVNQPIGGARTNAHAALRFLAANPPELGEVNEALECVVSDTSRAGEIIGRIRDQLKKRRPARSVWT